MPLTQEQMEYFDSQFGTQGLDDVQNYANARSRAEELKQIAQRGRQAALPAANPLEQVAQGAGKGVISTLKGASDIGGAIARQTVGRVANAVTGKGFTATPKEEFLEGVVSKEAVEDLTTPETGWEQAGFVGEKIAEFFMGGAAASSLTKSLHAPGIFNTLGRIAVNTLAPTTVSTVQEGEINKNVKNTALISGAFSTTGEVMNALSKTPAGQSLVKWLTEKLPGRNYNKIIRPSAKDFAFGKNPGETVAREGITANSRGDLLVKIGQRKAEIGNQMDEVLSKPGISGKTIDVKPLITDPIKAAKEQALRSGDKAYFSRLDDLENGLTKNFGEGFKVAGEKSLVLTPKEAQMLKIQLGRDTRWTGQAFDSDINQVRVSIYRAIDDAVDKIAPKMATLNQRYGGLLAAEKGLEKAIATAQRNATLGLRATGVGGVIGGISSLQGDDPVSAVLKGALGAAGFAVLGSTPMQTRVAQIYRSLTPENQTAFLEVLKNVTLGVKANQK